MSRDDENLEDPADVVNHISGKIYFNKEVSRLLRIRDASDKPLAKYCSIFRVPKLLGGSDGGAYTGAFVKIGCHYIGMAYRDEPYRVRYLKSFLKDAEQTRLNPISILQIILQNFSKIREHYQDLEVVSLTDYERKAAPKALYSSSAEPNAFDFAGSVLNDCAFLIEVFSRHMYQSQHGEHLQLSEGVSIRNSEILRDILVMENQLPFFIVKELYWRVYKPSSGINPYFTDIVCEFLGIEDRSKVEVDTNNEARCHHFLDLMRSHYAPSKGTLIDIDPAKRRYVVSPTASALHEAGVKFQVLLDDNKSRLLDIHFDKVKGILTIPKLNTEDPSMTLFKNMMAYEQCMESYSRFSTSSYISDYHYFMDCLINTPRDVELLADAGIVVNCLGYEAVCDMFNTISKNTKIGWRSYTYGGISEQLIDHCKNDWNRHKATLKNKYFGHPWAMVSVIYAAILLILTLIQVTTGILAVPGVLRNA